MEQLVQNAMNGLRELCEEREMVVAAAADLGVTLPRTVLVDDVIELIGGWNA